MLFSCDVMKRPVRAILLCVLFLLTTILGHVPRKYKTKATTPESNDRPQAKTRNTQHTPRGRVLRQGPRRMKKTAVRGRAPPSRQGKCTVKETFLCTRAAVLDRHRIKHSLNLLALRVGVLIWTSTPERQNKATQHQQKSETHSSH